MPKRTGYADLPLHSGVVPKWLADRMMMLGTLIVESLIQNYGKRKCLYGSAIHCGSSHSAQCSVWTGILQASRRVSCMPSNAGSIRAQKNSASASAGDEANIRGKHRKSSCILQTLQALTEICLSETVVCVQK